MSDGDRGNKPATLGAFGYFTAVILCCLIVGYLTYTSGRQDERRDKAPTAYSQAAKEDARRSCLGIESGAAFECIYEKVEASQEQAHNEQDLDAQQRAAFAALVSVIVAFLAFVATVAGVWFVKRTLDATLKAVEDTGLATKAMQKANDIARESMERQLRAYVSLELIEPINIGVDMRIICPISVKNYGQTPAYDFQIVAKFVAGGKAFEWQCDVRDIHLAQDLMPSALTIHPGIRTNSEVASEWELNQPIFNQFNDGTVIILAMVKATYRDAFGHVRYTTMQFRFAKANDNRPQRSTFDKTGNYAT